MNFQHLVSLLKSGKESINLSRPLESFSIHGDSIDPFIEPAFEKDEFAGEHPSILLISAVGCAGKTTLAKQLSHTLSVPVLDLAKHKAVADNTLTGILTSTYSADDVANVLKGLKVGAHAVIIDGLDEAERRLAEQGFEAFLDNVVELACQSPKPSVVLLGRGQVLETTWCHIADKCKVGLLHMQPFSIDNAKAYVDAKVVVADGQDEQYHSARDHLFHRLQGAFVGESQDGISRFLGYPPVLDSVAALLNEEKNYFKLSQSLDQTGGKEKEVQLLWRIADYLLEREQNEKAIPNFCKDIADKAGDSSLATRLYTTEEQCDRLLSHVCSEKRSRKLIDDAYLNAEYEESVASFLPEHPFISDRSFRNPVFESFVLAKCCASASEGVKKLVSRYANERRLTYHLFFFLQHVYSDGVMPVEGLNACIQSCSDFLATPVSLAIDVSGPEAADVDQDEMVAADVEIVVSGDDVESRFQTSIELVPSEQLSLGPSLFNTSLIVPSSVKLCGTPSIQSLGENSVYAKIVDIEGKDVSLCEVRNRDGRVAPSLVLTAEAVNGNVEEVNLHGGSFQIVTGEHSLHYPLVQHVTQRDLRILQTQVGEAYFRLRRIMLEFRSHSKGQLAKYKPKIEHARVLKNDTGRQVLEQLKSSGVLTSDAKFYYVAQDRFSEVLGITWQELRSYGTSPSLESFISTISV